MIIGAMHEKGRRAVHSRYRRLSAWHRVQLAQQPGIHGTIQNMRDRFEDAVLGRSDARNLTEQIPFETPPNTSYISFANIEGESNSGASDEKGIYGFNRICMQFRHTHGLATCAP